MRPTSRRTGVAIAVAVIAVVLVSIATIAVFAVAGRTETVAGPPVNGTFDDQIGGAYPPTSSATIVERDHDAEPAAGRYSICYVNAFQTQADERSLWSGPTADLLLRDHGRTVADPDWPGELLLDTSSPAKRVRIAAIVGGWIDECAEKGFTALEPDNLDSWTRSHGLLTEADNVDLAELIVTRARTAGLAVAQKNAPELAEEGIRTIGFDFAIAEECQRYSECGMYTKAYGDHVIEIEYTDGSSRDFAAACAARGSHISIVLRDRDVVPRGAHGYHSTTC